MPESTQHKLDRVRPPRVQITYDVEIGDAIVMKELPFVVGIMSDLSGKPAEPLPPLKERKYVEIDRDNFNDIMKSIGPRLALRADNRLAGDGEKMNVELTFANLDDFSPINVLKQVEPLRKLFEARTRLADLLAKLDGNDALDALLQDVVKNTDGMQEIKSATGGNGNGEKG
ncbi:MAG: type VI secretion system contractile sheath small subunit [Acidobacteria bacterium]|nr:MAG: type VI secretion system contractile sheath small subunit [Acidobacteriota bacterium]PYS81576.1 MAG: type VI secretion system contractile sheath small subunit [Acidobacteriota bacterium]